MDPAEDEDEGDDFVVERNLCECGRRPNDCAFDPEDPDSKHRDDTPRRDPDREMSYEDWRELSAPVEHPGDSWMGNEDI